MTTFTITPNPATAGQAVTLAATVVDVFQDPVTIGTVTFLNGAQVLGTVQAVDSPPITATLQVRFGPGTYSITARYDGNKVFQPSQSQPQTLTVTGTEPTTCTLSAQPDGNNYDFLLSLFGSSFPPLAGSGTLNDLTQNGLDLGTISLPGPGSPTFQSPLNYATVSSPTGIAAADLDGDGVLDLIVGRDVGTANNVFGVLLGNPDGTFQQQVTHSTGSATVGVGEGDFNGDGFADLVMANSGSNSVDVLFGDGQGGFPTHVVNDTGLGPVAVAIADFDQDGAADIAVSNFNVGSGHTISVLLGSGTGTFGNQVTYGVGNGPYGIVAADLNGDGFPDLAVANVVDGTVSILLNQGDGTFLLTQSLPVLSGPLWIAVGDFNRDGIPDLAVTNFGNNNGNTVSILIGNGNGTFQPHQDFSTGANGVGPYQVVVADFDGDGILDLATANQTSNTVSVLFGLAAGGFSQPQVYPVGSGNSFLVAADFNGDSVPDLGVTNNDNGAGKSMDVLLGGTLSSGQLNNIPVYGSGNQDIQSTFTPTGNIYASCVSNVVTVTPIGPAPTTTTISSQNPSTYGQPVTFSANVTAVNHGTPTGTVTFTADGNLFCTATLVPAQNGSVATCPPISSLTAGNHPIVASYSGDPNFAPSQGQANQEVDKAATTVQVTSTPNPSQCSQPVTITARVTGSFGGVPTGSIDFTDTFNGNGTVLCSGVQLNANGLAACITQTLAVGTHDQIVANYHGDQDYLAGSGTDSPPQVVMSGCADFTLLPISPNIVQVIQTYTNDNEPYFAQTINLTVQPQSGYTGTVTLSCSVSPPLTGGRCTVNPPASGSLAGGNLTTTLTISTGSTTPVGLYTVTVQAQDTGGRMHSATLTLVVDYQSPPTQMTSGGVGPPTQLLFPGDPGTMLSNFSCPLVSGTGINGSEDLGAIGGVCSFSPTTTSLPNPVTVTITGCTVARVRMNNRIFASLFLGIPGIVFLGSLRKKSRAVKKVLRIFAVFVSLSILLIGLGCGGVGQTTPSGSYLVLVQGTGPDGTVYSAVVPVTVTQPGH